MSVAPSAATSKKAGRLWEVDALRGLALVLMVFYHFMWDLHFFGLYKTNMLVGPWQVFARSIASMFIFVMGVSLTLSYSRVRQRAGRDSLFGKYLLRGAKIFAWGLLITIATYFFIGRGFVVFGILHLLGLSIILAYPLLGVSRWLSLAGGLLVIAAGIYVDSLRSESPWLIWLGVKQIGRSMVDYYPVLPWFGIALLGVFVGDSLYPRGRRHVSLPDLSKASPVHGLVFLGQHSLLIYLIHQPILIGAFIALGYGSF
jgi:uncharacterized membrane protein